MPRKDYNAKMNEYMKNRWSKRRLSAVEKLGGSCVMCGSTENLEFDHIDPSTKIMSIASASSRSEEFFWKEVAKCQLLCSIDHKKKSAIEKSVEHGGGVSGKRNCKCQPCKNKKNEYMRAWKRT